MIENPFLTLHMDKNLLVSLSETRDWNQIRQLAAGWYKVLAKMHHPDKGGDAARMQRYTEAYELLGSDDEVELYVGELLDDSVHIARQSQTVSDRAVDTLRAERDTLLGSLAHVDQLSLFATREQTEGATRVSLLALSDSDYLVLDVYSSSATRLYQSVAEFPDTVTDLIPAAVFYRDGVWSQQYINDEHEVIEEVSHDRLIKRNEVGVVGCMREQVAVSSSVDFRRLSTGAERTRAPEWLNPADAWFLSDLRFFVQPGDDIVVKNAQGDLTVLGKILGVCVL